MCFFTLLLNSRELSFSKTRAKKKEERFYFFKSAQNEPDAERRQLPAAFNFVLIILPFKGFSEGRNLKVHTSVNTLQCFPFWGPFRARVSIDSDPS